MSSGTNADGVVIDPSRASVRDKAMLSPRLLRANISPGDVASVTIGTTHFVNAVMERDANRLSKVAVIRLSGPFGKHAPPCVDWPDDMRELILGYYALAKGGLEVDGSLISDIDDIEIRSYCKEINDRGIKSNRQEERAAEIIRDEIPGCDVVCSNEVANLGFLERENAAVLNASILSLARKTIRSFQEPVEKLGLECPVFITQNDGTLLSGEMAARLPIRTFSSGPTNSMRGAAFPVGEELNEAIMVVDIGGTTSDAAYSDLAGVRMNFSCPDVKSTSLGGGSIVRKGDSMTIGPDSVGYKLTKEAVAFCGQILTTTDCTVYSDLTIAVGNRDLIDGALTDEEVERFKSIIKHKLEKVIDMMKTSPGDVPVLLVGGGAIIAPDVLKGASKAIKSKFVEVANATGAATARSKTTARLLGEISAEAVDKAVAAGALSDSVTIAEIETIPFK
ncbi:Hydantoinase/oxoprolinase domain-containing protein [Trichoderma compactum]